MPVSLFPKGLTSWLPETVSNRTDIHTRTSLQMKANKILVNPNSNTVNCNTAILNSKQKLQMYILFYTPRQIYTLEQYIKLKTQLNTLWSLDATSESFNFVEIRLSQFHPSLSITLHFLQCTSQTIEWY